MIPVQTALAAFEEQRSAKNDFVPFGHYPEPVIDTDTLRLCAKHRTPFNLCAECGPLFLRYLGDLAFGMLLNRNPYGLANFEPLSQRRSGPFSLEYAGGNE